ncbi:MAG: DUF1080 domain-containing protein [Planctomycetota bacterium]
MIPKKTITHIHQSVLRFTVFGILATGFVATSIQAQTETKQDDKWTEKKLTPKLHPVEWDGEPIHLLTTKKAKDDGSLGNWEPISFGGEGDCSIKDGILTIESGDPMTGVTLPKKDLPKKNYELTLEARRTDGIDFFCGLTFPVNEDHICLIVGGWSGAVVGLSNLDDEDASRNPSRRLMTFEDDRWYKIRIRVLEQQIVVWIDDECVIDQNIKGKKISLRGDTLSCRPLGLCTFQTTSETRKLKLRKFKLKHSTDHDQPKSSKAKPRSLDPTGKPSKKKSDR